MNEECFGKCADCPGIGGMIEIDRSLQRAEQEIQEQAFDKALDTEIAPQLYDYLAENGVLVGDLGDSEPVASPEELAVMLRRNAGSILESIAHNRERLSEDVTNVTRNCSGPLKLRAKKAGRQVLVTLCDNPIAPRGDSVEPVRVTRF